VNEPLTFTNIRNLTCSHPDPADGNLVVQLIRQKLLDGHEPPVLVRHKSAGGFEVERDSKECFYAYLREDFEHIPVIVIPKEN
jgi:hypothetical protein